MEGTKRQLLIRMLTNDIGTLNCVNCQQTIAHPKHAFSLLDTNIIGTFVNPSGAVMQVATFEKVENENAILCIGECVTEHSWFQGYGWTMTCCSQCHTHLGWRFDASPQPLLPSRFYGFRSECLIKCVHYNRCNYRHSYFDGFLLERLTLWSLSTNPNSVTNISIFLCYISYYIAPVVV